MSIKMCLNAQRTLRRLAATFLATTAFVAQPDPVSGQTFPYELSPSTDLTLVGAATGLALPSAEYDAFDLTSGFAGLRRDDVNSFDRMAVGQFSERAREYSHNSRDVLLAGAAALIASEATWSRDFLTLAVMTVEVTAVTAALTTRTKAWTERLRPYAYDEEMDPDAKRRFAAAQGEVRESFYSGHAVAGFTAAMYGATVLGDLHGWSDLTRKIRFGALGVAATTAAARVLGGQHYPSDVLVGAGVGMLVGWAVPYLHRKDRDGRLSVTGGPESIGLRLSVGPGS